MLARSFSFEEVNTQYPELLRPTRFLRHAALLVPNHLRRCCLIYIQYIQLVRNVGTVEGCMRLYQSIRHSEARGLGDAQVWFFKNYIDISSYRVE